MSFSITVFIPFLYPVLHRRTKKELLCVQSSTSLRRAATNIIFSTVVLSQKPLRKSLSLKLNTAVQTKFLCFRATCLFQKSNVYLRNNREMNWNGFHCFQNQLPRKKNRSIYDFLPTVLLLRNRKFVLIASKFMELYLNF